MKKLQSATTVILIVFAFHFLTHTLHAQEITLDISLTNISCTGMTDGNARVIASGGMSPYTYKWSNGEESPIINNLGPGTYVVTVSDSNGVQTQSGIILNEIIPIEIELELQDGICGRLGKISAKVQGGLGPFQYDWSNGSFEREIRNLVQGQYDLTVTDRGKCPASISAEIIVHPDLILNSTFDLPTCVGRSDGNISVSQTGGHMPIAYEWNNGDTSTLIENLPAGIYSVFTIDDFGCTDGINIILSDPDALQVEVINQNNSLFAKVEGGTPSYNYSWSNGATGTTVISNLEPGEYGLTVEDTHGCSAIGNGDILGPLHVNDLSQVQSFSLQPTIVLTELQVQMELDRPQQIALEIYSLEGQLISKLEVHNRDINFSIPLDHNTPAGFYFLVVRSTEGWVFSEKFIKR